MVAIGRALLSDPEWVKKVKTGDFEAIILSKKIRIRSIFLIL